MDKEVKTPEHSTEKSMGTLLRLQGYMIKNYKVLFLLVCACVVAAALTTLNGTLFMQTLIDDYIVPMTQGQSQDFSALAGALCSLAAIYLIGILCSFAYNQLMVNISQGNLAALFQPQ